MKTYVLNGVNLGRLGTRQTDIYGLTDYATLAEMCVKIGVELGLDVEVPQTDARARADRLAAPRRRRACRGGAEPGRLVALLDRYT